MEVAIDPIIKHRLELLERTVYALQAQHRVLEYRIQYVEGENKALKGRANHQISAPVPQPTPPPATSYYTHVSEKTSEVESICLQQNQDYYPQEPPGFESSPIIQKVKTEPKGPSTIDKSKGNGLQSILDEPSAISTPVLKPARTVSVFLSFLVSTCDYFRC